MSITSTVAYSAALALAPTAALIKCHNYACKAELPESQMVSKSIAFAYRANPWSRHMSTGYKSHLFCTAACAHKFQNNGDNDTPRFGRY